MQGKQEQAGKEGPTPPPPHPPPPDFLHSAPLAAQSAKDIQQN